MRPVLSSDQFKAYVSSSNSESIHIVDRSADPRRWDTDMFGCWSRLLRATLGYVADILGFGDIRGSRPDEGRLA